MWEIILRYQPAHPFYYEIMHLNYHFFFDLFEDISGMIFEIANIIEAENSI